MDLTCSVILLSKHTVGINIECEGICYSIMPGKNSNIAGAPSWFKEISLYFYEVTQTRNPPYWIIIYCFVCKIKKQKTLLPTYNRDIQNSTSDFQWAFVILCQPADCMRTEAPSFTAHFQSL